MQNFNQNCFKHSFQTQNDGLTEDEDEDGNLKWPSLLLRYYDTENIDALLSLQLWNSGNIIDCSVTNHSDKLIKNSRCNIECILSCTCFIWSDYSHCMSHWISGFVWMHQPVHHMDSCHGMCQSSAIQHQVQSFSWTSSNSKNSFYFCIGLEHHQ